jgi:hypothetical protein
LSCFFVFIDIAGGTFIFVILWGQRPVAAIEERKPTTPALKITAWSIRERVAIKDRSYSFPLQFR